MKIKNLLMALSLCFLLASVAFGKPAKGEKGEKKEPKVPKGEIPFSFNYEETLKACKDNGKPIFLYTTYDG